MSKAYSPEIKQEVLALIFDRGISSRAAATHTGISYSTVRRWVKEANVNAAAKKNNYIIRKLEDRLESAVEEGEILKEAISIFVRDRKRNSEK